MKKMRIVGKAAMLMLALAACGSTGPSRYDAEQHTLAGGVFAEEYTIFCSGEWEGFVTVAKEAGGKITITYNLSEQPGKFGPAVNLPSLTHELCPLIPKGKEFTLSSPSTKNIVIDGNTTTETNVFGSWTKTVVDGNTTTQTHSNGYWAETVVDGNTTTRTGKNGFEWKTVVDGNTTTRTYADGDWTKITFEGNTQRSINQDGRVGHSATVVDGNTTTYFSDGKIWSTIVVEGNTTRRTWGKDTKIQARKTVVNKQGKNVYITVTTAHSHNSSGYEYYQQKDYDRAIVEFTEALKLDPDSVYAYVQRGNVYLMKGDRNRARTDWRKALEIDPNDTTARNNLAKFQ